MTTTEQEVLERIAKEHPKVLVTSPFSGQEYDLAPLFRFLNERHDKVVGPESFTTLADIIFQSVQEVSEACGRVESTQDVHNAHYFLMGLGRTLLSIRPPVNR